MDTCAPFEGNSDFYGLGIRVGIYLQWISAWISLLLDLESAQATYDTNSIFVFAILVATIIAARQGTAAIEMYLMLQFMVGSYVTTLSTLGMRLWVMSPDRLAKLETMLLDRIRRPARARRSRRHERLLPLLLQEWAHELQTQATEYYIRKTDSSPFMDIGILQSVYLLWHLPTLIPFKMLSPLKPPGLSWSGVVWRTTIVAMIAAYNLAFWFDSSGSGAQEPPRPGCGPPYIFFFSKQQLKGPIVILCQVAAVIIAIMVFPMALLLFLLTIRVGLYVCLFVSRDFIYHFSPTTPQTLQSTLSRINALLETQAVPSGVLQLYQRKFNTTFALLTDVIGLLATPNGEMTRFSDVIKLFVSLGMGKVTEKEVERSQPVHAEGLISGWKGARSDHRIFCSLLNVCVFLSIAWFITSIENTIRWNGIRGVNSINTTGQLIPLIVGCVSASQVVKKLMLLVGAKKYPDWVDVKLEVEVGVGGPMISRIVKENGGDDLEERNTEGDNIASGQTDGYVMAMRTRRRSV